MKRRCNGLLFACVALVAAGALLARAGERGQPAAVTQGKKLIGDNAEHICLFAHAESSYGYKSHEYVGHKRTSDGYYELTYRFIVKGNLKTQNMYLSFFFKDNGDFEFLRIKDYTTIYKPFKQLSTRYLEERRKQMAARPIVQNNTELLRVIDTADGQVLCELHLKLAQAAGK
jgi:hypothetical protein